MIKALTLLVLLLALVISFRVIAASDGDPKPQAPENPDPCNRFKMRVIKPDESVDYKMRIVVPAEGIDYKGKVIDPCRIEGERVVGVKPLLPGLGKKVTLVTPSLKSQTSSPTDTVKTPSEILKKFELPAKNLKAPQH